LGAPRRTTLFYRRNFQTRLLGKSKLWQVAPKTASFAASGAQEDKKVEVGGGCLRPPIAKSSTNIEAGNFRQIVFSINVVNLYLTLCATGRADLEALVRLFSLEPLTRNSNCRAKPLSSEMIATMKTLTTFPGHIRASGEHG